MRTYDYMLSVCFLFVAAGCATNQKGALVPTDRPYDLAIDGEGYFIVETGRGGYLFTRKGDFVVDAQRYLATADGYRIAPALQLPENTNDLVVTLDGQVGALTIERTPEPVGKIKIATFPDASRLERDGDYRGPTASSGDPVPHTPGSGGAGTIKSRMLEK